MMHSNVCRLELKLHKYTIPSSKSSWEKDALNISSELTDAIKRRFNRCFRNATANILLWQFAAI
jgi:hypothetical protein